MNSTGVLWFKKKSSKLQIASSLLRFEQKECCSGSLSLHALIGSGMTACAKGRHVGPGS